MHWKLECDCVFLAIGHGTAVLQLYLNAAALGDCLELSQRDGFLLAYTHCVQLAHWHVVVVTHAHRVQLT